MNHCTGINVNKTTGPIAQDLSLELVIPTLPLTDLGLLYKFKYQLWYHSEQNYRTQKFKIYCYSLTIDSALDGPRGLVQATA